MLLKELAFGVGVRGKGLCSELVIFDWGKEKQGRAGVWGRVKAGKQLFVVWFDERTVGSIGSKTLWTTYGFRTEARPMRKTAGVKMPGRRAVGTVWGDRDEGEFRGVIHKHGLS